MTNLFDFLSEWHPSVKIYVESKDGKIYSGLISDIDEEVALSARCETIILGAFGCGAFQNNPEVVALANRNVIKDYLHAFKNIEFAVYCPPHDDSNFKIFERVLKVYCN